MKKTETSCRCAQPWVVGMTAILLLTMALPATLQGQGTAAASNETTNTLITSEKLTFEYQKKFAIFEENVRVEDPRMLLEADRIVVRFTDENGVKTITATGKVKITQADKIATCGKAEYDVATGQVVLTVEPVVTRGGLDRLTGQKITFWRDDDRVHCEKPVLKFFLPADKADNKGRGL